MTTVMGIDCASQCTGIAIIDGEGELLKKFKVVRKKNEEKGDFFFRIAILLRKNFEKFDVKHVSMEELNFTTNFKTAKILMEVQGCIRLIVRMSLGNEVEMYHNATWRSRLGIKRPKYEYEWYMSKNRRTGKKKKAKKKIIEKVIEDGKKIPKDIKYVTIQTINEAFGISLKYKDNDIADAIGLAQVLHEDVMRIPS